MYYTTPRHQVVLCELHCNPIILKNQALRIFMRLVFFLFFFFSTSEPEYLLQPSEASVWDRTALVWRLHHRHWSGSVLQVGCVKIWQLSCFIYSQRYNESFHLEDRSCFFFFYVITFFCNFCLLHWLICPALICLQKENHVPKHCERNRANDRRKGGHRLRLQQSSQERNRHVCTGNHLEQLVLSE